MSHQLMHHAGHGSFQSFVGDGLRECHVAFGSIFFPGNQEWMCEKNLGNQRYTETQLFKYWFHSGKTFGRLHIMFDSKIKFELVLGLSLSFKNGWGRRDTTQTTNMELEKRRFQKNVPFQYVSSWWNFIGILFEVCIAWELWKEITLRITPQQ